MPMARARFSAKLPTLESIFITLGLWVTQEYTQRRNRRILSPLQKEVCIYKQPNLYIKNLPRELASGPLFAGFREL